MSAPLVVGSHLGGRVHREVDVLFERDERADRDPPRPLVEQLQSGSVVTESLPPHCYSSVSREIGENSAGEVFENTLTSLEASLYDRCGFERPSVGFVGGVD